MAIIYTYPKLQNPQGNELIVVSDVNNRNATRLITIADIASLVPSGGGGGCATAINRINTSNGEYIATGCNPVEFSSSDNSIAISAASNGIVNFSAGCATTYVLKPVSCDNVGNCSPTTDSSTWLFTCESSFASTADQSIPVVVANGGVQVQTSFSSNNCFYVETWSPIPAPTECANCCTPGEERGIYEQCNSNNGLAGCPSMAQQIILSPIQGVFPPVVLATYGDPNTGQAYTCCYSYSSAIQGAPETPNYTAQALAQGQNCDTAPCINISQSNEYQKCTECDDTQPNTIYLADNFEAVSFAVNENETAACYINIGKSTEPITQGFYTSIEDIQSCEQLDNSGLCPLTVAQLDRCAELSPSGIAGNTATVYVDVNNPNLQAYPSTYRISFSDGSFSCYVRAQQDTCEIPTVISTIVLAVENCDDASCADVQTNYQWRNCEDEGFTSTSSDLSIYAPAPGEYVFGSAGSGSWECIVVAQGGDGTGAAKDLDGFVAQVDCNCCENNYNVFTYEQCGTLSGCPGLPQTVNVQVPLGVGDDPANAPITIIVENTTTGATCCYTSPEPGSCLAATPNFAYVSTVDGGCNDESCTEDPLGTRYIYTPCDDQGTDIVTETAIHSVDATFIFYDCKWYNVPPQTQGNEPLSGITSNEVLNSLDAECPELNQLRFERCDGLQPDLFVNCGSNCLSKGSWVLNGVYIYEEVCYTLTGVTSGQVATECEEAFEIVDGGCEAAECAEETVKYLYEKCQGVDSDDCANAFGQVVLEGTAAELLPNLVIENTSNNVQCCYVRLGVSEEPVTANHSIVVSINNCDDETLIEAGCKDAEYWQWRNCGDEEWINTESDLSSEAPSLETIYVFGDNDATCIEIRKTDDGTGVGNPINISGWSDYSSTETPCDCCNNFNVVEYSKCDIENPAEGCANMDPTVRVINPNYPNQAPAVVQLQDGNGNTCCYTLNGETCFGPSVGYSITATEISGCNDEPCVAATPEPKAIYSKCEEATGGTCAEMLPEVIIQAPIGDLFNFAIINNGDGAQCCYSKGEQTEGEPTANHTIVSEFESCDDLPEEICA